MISTQDRQIKSREQALTLLSQFIGEEYRSTELCFSKNTYPFFCRMKGKKDELIIYLDNLGKEDMELTLVYSVEYFKTTILPWIVMFPLVLVVVINQLKQNDAWPPDTFALFVLIAPQIFGLSILVRQYIVDRRREKQTLDFIKRRITDDFIASLNVSSQ